MSEMSNRIECLEREMRGLRGWILVLSIALVTTFALGATQGTPDELTLRRLAIVDYKGRERIVAMTEQYDSASLVHYDSNGKKRIVAETDFTGRASLVHYDYDGKMRIVSTTDRSSLAAIKLGDSKGKIVWGHTSSE